MKLSILIPTLPQRSNFLRRITSILQPQINRHHGLVELKINDAGKSMSTGMKRNLLIENSTGEYFVQIDDDDQVPNYYVDEIMNAIDKLPDVITFIGYMTTDGANRRNFTIKLGEKYEDRNGHYYRFPNHICAYRRQVVRGVQFPNITIGEDYEWALQVRNKKLLRSEVHIDKEMYHYMFRSRK